MTKEELERGIEIKRNLEMLENLRHVMSIPHPHIYDGCIDVCLISVGSEAEKEIKDAVLEAIKRNKDFLEKELEEL